MRFLSVCSGIEAASVAWEPLGWECIGVAEIEPFPCKVLHKRFGIGRPMHMPDPDDPGLDVEDVKARRAAIKSVAKIPLAGLTPNFGDFTRIDTTVLGAVDLLVGGTPCQAFSVAGKRLSLADARGNLSLAYAVLAHELVRSHGLRWAVWENVPGVLSTDDNAFGCLLGALVGADDPVLPCERPDRGKSNGLWRWKQRDDGEWIHAASWPDAGMVEGPRARAAWGILDAQYFGLAQRRERVFVVVGFGDGTDPSQILFEPESLCRHPPSRREAREDLARPIAACPPGGSDYRNDADTADNLIAHALRAEGFDASEDGTGRGTPIVPVEIAHSLRARHNTSNREDQETFVPVAFGGNDTRGPINVSTALNAHGGPCGRQDFESETFVAHPIGFTCKDHGQDASVDLAPTPRAMPGQHHNAGGQVAIAFDCKAGANTGFSVGEVPGALRGEGHGGGHAAIAFDTTQITSATNRCNPQPGDPSVAIPILESGKRTGASTTSKKAGDGIGAAGDPMYTLGADSRHAVATSWAVRRLTPTECHRLQGFPDRHCDIEGASDGPVYRALGNSMPRNVMAWIGRKIQSFEGKS